MDIVLGELEKVNENSGEILHEATEISEATSLLNAQI